VREKGGEGERRRECRSLLLKVASQVLEDGFPTEVIGTGCERVRV
jgi:hypothetical protein